MEGNWTAGVLTGAATYSQPAFQLSANYTKGVPEGEATFTMASFRSLRGALDFLCSFFRFRQHWPPCCWAHCSKYVEANTLASASYTQSIPACIVHDSCACCLLLWPEVFCTLPHAQAARSSVCAATPQYRLLDCCCTCRRAGR